MKATQIIGNDNVIYTYLPISYDTIQSSTQGFPIAVAPNVVLEVPDKTMTFMNSQENGMLTNCVANGTFIEDINLMSESVEMPGTTTACIINQESILNKSESRKIKENLKCDTCNKEFDKVSSYKKHLLVHRNVKKFKCEHCFESYNIEDNYKLHMALHGQNQPTCPLCKRQFQRLASLKSHLMMHQVEETFVCRECLAEFEKEDEYNKHMETHSIARLNLFENIPYICSYCNYLFEDPKDYKEHVSYHIKIKKLVYNPKKTRRRTTNNKEYSHRCSVCSKSFPKNCLLERHMRIHNGEKPFACPKCDKAFAQKGTLQIHLVKHSGHKPYKCTLCPAEYFQKGNLRVHVEKTHTAPPNIDKMYKCTQCTCIFRKIASLNAHITKAHGDMKNIDELTDINGRVKALREMAEQFPNPSKENIVAGNTKIDLLNAEPNETFVKLAENCADGTLRRYVVKQRKVGDTKWFICLYCSKEFKKPSDLIRHIRIHTRERPYKCKTCNQAFALKSTLLSHLNTHDGKREYQCLLCFKYFTSARTLSAHTKKHGKSGSATSLKYKCSTCKKLFGTFAKVRSHMEVHNCNNDDIEKDSRDEQQENLVPLRQPMVETDKGLVSVPAPKPRIPHAEMEEYKNRPYKCHKCDAAFTKPTHVKRHMLRHSGERNFKCELCAKTFFTSYALKEHLRFHNPEKKFACTLCPQRFVAKELLKRHQIKHSSARPYICPYCKRRFKTAPLCRKHINIHGSDTNLLNSELETITNTNPVKMIDLSDTIRDNPFDLDTQIDDGTVFYKAGNTQVELRQDVTTMQLRNFNEKKSTKNKGKSKKSKYKSQGKRKVTDSNITYNHDVLNLPTNAQIFVSKEGHYTIIMPETNESETSEINVNVGSIDQGPATFISYDEYPSVNSDVYNTILSNVKLQNSDPILMSTIGESQDSNILFMDPTLPQSSEFQSETQNFEPFNPTIFNTPADLNLGVQPTVANTNTMLTQDNQTVTSTSRAEQSIKPPQSKLGFVNNTGNVLNKRVAGIDNSKLLLAPESVTLHDNLIITLNEDEFASMNFGLNNGSNSTNDNLNLNIMDSFVCMLCKTAFGTGNDLEKHQCISTEFGDDVSVEKGANSVGLDQNLHDIPQNEQITLITDYNDQLQTAHIEISTDEPGSDSPILRETLREDDFEERDATFRSDKAKKFENKCTYCGKSFKKASDLVRHVRTHTGEKPYSCTKCNKSFSLKSTLQSHQRTHSDMRNKEFVCSVCNCNFSCRATLKIHMRIHTGVKPYACHICHMKFRTSSSRKSHLATHAKETKRNEYKSANQFNRYLEGMISNQAKIEDSNNIVTENMENSEIQHIEGLPVDLLQQLQNAALLLQETDGDILNDGLMQLNYDTATILNPKTVKTVPIQDVLNVTDAEQNGNQASKKFECNYCHKTYTTKAVLRKHQKRHKKDFQCPNCDKQFDSQHALDKHVKLHSGYRPFSCTHCANSFSEERSLKTHMKRIHNVHT